MLNEGNRRDEYLEKKGESTKTTAMRKSSERRGRFSAGDTHQDTERENITWARPGTRPHADSLDRQRKGVHRTSRGRKKPQAGSSPEDRRWDKFVGDEKKGKYQKLQDRKERGERTNIDAQKQGLLRKGERRRELRSQAVNAIRRAVGGGYVSEAKVDDRLSADQKEVIRNRRLSPGERLPVRGETPRNTEERLTQTRRETTARNRGGRTVRGSRGIEPWGITDRKKYYPKKVSARRDELRAKRAKNNIRSFKEGKTFEEFMIEARKLARRKPRRLDFEVREEKNPIPRFIKYHKDKKLRELKKRKEGLPTRTSISRYDPKNLADKVKAVVHARRIEDISAGVIKPKNVPEVDSSTKNKIVRFREENNLTEMPYFVRKVDEEFKDLTPEKEEKVTNRVGELFRDVQVQDARMKELRKKPFGKYRPEVKKEKEAIFKSMKKKQKLVQNASDALIHTSVSRQAKNRKRAEEIKQKLRDLGEEP